MQSVGEKLRRARLEKQTSLDEVYRQTKIHTHVLEALEQDRAHNFLSFVYIKGFLRAYARYLGLDSEKLLKEYIDSQKVESQAPQVALKKKPKVSSQLNLFLAAKVVSIIILSCIFIFYFRFVLRHISSSPQKSKMQAVKVKVMPAPVITKELVLEVKTKQECWMKVKADGKIVFQNILKKGKVEKWSAKQQLELRIGKPEAIEASLNGEPIDLKRAQVKRTLIITHEGIQGK